MGKKKAKELKKELKSRNLNCIKTGVCLA